MIPGIGTLINSFSVIGIGILGRLFIKKEIKNFENNLLPLGLLVLTLGIRESLKSPDFILTLFAVLVGSVIGTYLKIEEKIERFGEYLHNRFEKNSLEIKNSNFLKQGHNKLNFAISYATLRCLKVKSKEIINTLTKFKGLPHRLELIGSINNIKFYNDSKATNVSATCSALKGFNKVFLIAGGSKKGATFKTLIKYLDKIAGIYLIGETAEEIKKVLGSNCSSFICKGLEEAVKKSYKKSLNSKKKFPILLSPACASFDQYNNYQSRGDHFRTIFEKISYGLQ